MAEHEATGTDDRWWRTGAGRAGLAGAGLLVAAVVVVLALSFSGRPGEPVATPTAPSPTVGGGGNETDEGPAGLSDDEEGAPEGDEGEAAGPSGGDDLEVEEPVVPQDQLDPALPPVALEDPAPFGDGVTASLVAIEGARLGADGPGEVAGPGLRLTVRVDNGTAQAIAGGLAVVNLYAGPDLLPCEPMTDGARELSGDIAAGEAAEGVYVFAVPADLRDHIRVTVAYDPTVPMVVMEGPAPAA